MTTRIEGGCHCGAVRYALTGAPSGSMICHCETCRRISGAPVVAWLTFEPEAFAFIRGEPAHYASSPDVARQFCGGCGTQLTYRRGDYDKEIDIATASLDDANAFPPTHHSWVSHDLGWLKFGDGLPTFARSRYGRD